MDRAEIKAAATVLDIASEFCAGEALPALPMRDADFQRLLKSASFDLELVERAEARKRAGK